VEGRLQTRSWEGQDGQKRRSTEVIVNDFEFLESRGAAAASQAAASHEELPPPEDQQHGVRDVDPDDIPF
jgi:single-strand DNA-binding protein